MAELFSLMPESTSCKNAPVAAIRSQSRSTLRNLFQHNTFASRDISRETRRARLCARRGTIRRCALEITRDPDPMSFRARAGNAYRVVLATVIGSDREESRPRHSHTFLVECAKLYLPVAQALACALAPRRSVRKSMTEITALRNPMAQNRQLLQGVYFLSQKVNLPNGPTEK
ncbi:MAG: hypothetical protein ACYDC3_17130 [Candidatus Binataceae bacterium]